MLPREIEARALLLAGDAERCARLDLGPHAVARATCLYELGRRQEAKTIVDSVVTALNTGTLVDTVFSEVARVGDLAVHYAWLGDPAQSHVWLKRAYELSPTGVEARELTSALFDRVREDRTFRREVERIQAETWEKVRAAGQAAYEKRFVKAQALLPEQTRLATERLAASSGAMMLLVLPHIAE